MIRKEWLIPNIPLVLTTIGILYFMFYRVIVCDFYDGGLLIFAHVLGILFVFLRLKSQVPYVGLNVIVAFMCVISKGIYMSQYYLEITAMSLMSALIGYLCLALGRKKYGYFDKDGEFIIPKSESIFVQDNRRPMLEEMNRPGIDLKFSVYLKFNFVLYALLFLLSLVFGIIQQSSVYLILALNFFGLALTYIPRFSVGMTRKYVTLETIMAVLMIGTKVYYMNWTAWFILDLVLSVGLIPLCILRYINVGSGSTQKDTKDDNIHNRPLRLKK